MSPLGRSLPASEAEG